MVSTVGCSGRDDESFVHGLEPLLDLHAIDARRGRTVPQPRSKLALRGVIASSNDLDAAIWQIANAPAQLQLLCSSGGRSTVVHPLHAASDHKANRARHVA